MNKSAESCCMSCNVNYSFITREILEEYYKANFLNKEELDRKYMIESIFRFIYNISAFIVFIIIFIWTRNNIFPNLYRYMLSVQLGNQQINLINKILLLGLVGVIYWVVKMRMSIYLFPINARDKREYKCKKEIEVYARFFVVQEDLLKNEIIRISTDEFRQLTITSLPFDGIEYERTIKMKKEDYKNTIKKECLDFRWLDYKINEICKKSGFHEVISI